MPTSQNSSRARTVRRRSLAVQRERFLLSTGLETGFFLLALCLSTYGASRWLSPNWALIAFANFTWMITLLFRIDARVTVLALPQIVNNVSTMVALILIERGGEMFELGLVGRPGPWSNALNLYHLAFYIGLLATAKPLLNTRWLNSSTGLTPIYDRYARPIAICTLGICLGIGAILTFRGLQSGFPLLQGTDRFAFRRFSADKVTLYALNLKFVLAYTLGALAFIMPLDRSYKVASFVIFFIFILLFFLFGDKFFTQLSAVSAFFAPYFFKNYLLIRRRIPLYLTFAIAALIPVTGVTIFIYSNGFRETPTATSKRLTDRMVGQGELWFVQSTIGAPILQWNSRLIQNFQNSLTIKSVDLFANKNSLGANYFSNRYAPDYLRRSLGNNAGSVTYTEVTAAMAIVLFGWLGGIIMMAVLGAIFGLACWYLASAIQRRSMMSVFFSAYIYMQLRISIIQAAPWVIASIFSIRWISLIAAIEIVLIFFNDIRDKRHIYLHK